MPHSFHVAQSGLNGMIHLHAEPQNKNLFQGLDVKKKTTGCFTATTSYGNQFLDWLCSGVVFLKSTDSSSHLLN